MTIVHHYLSVLFALCATAALAQDPTTVPYTDGGSVSFTIPDRLEALSVGQPAPALSGTDLAGAPADIPTRRAVYFFAYADCALCDEALAEIAGADYRLRRRANLVYVDLYDDVATLRTHLTETFGTDAFDVLVADEATFEAFPLARFPTVVVVDKKGEIAEVREGYEEGVLAGLLR